MTLQCDAVRGVTPVQVSGGTDRDHQLACAAVSRAVTFFVDQGLAPDLRLRIEFRQAVYLDLNDSAKKAIGAAGKADQVAAGAYIDRIVGAFHPGSRSVRMTTEASPWLRAYNYFGLPVSDEMIMSMLTHEITHALSKTLYAPTLLAAGADIHVQEQYVAFVAQLVTMAPRLRADILTRFATSADRFDGEADINALALGFSPESFGVKSYRHFTSEAGGSPFLRRLYSGEFRPSLRAHYLY